MTNVADLPFKGLHYDLIPYVDTGYISVDKASHASLYLYRTTTRCNEEGHWNELTRMCQGLIVNGRGRIVSRPFNRPYEWHDGMNFANHLFVLVENKPGTQCLLYRLRSGEYRLASRQGFESAVSQAATRRFNAQGYHTLPWDVERLSYVFLWPPVGGGELELLSVIHIDDGEECYAPKWYPHRLPEIGLGYLLERPDRRSPHGYTALLDTNDRFLLKPDDLESFAQSVGGPYAARI